MPSAAGPKQIFGGAGTREDRAYGGLRRVISFPTYRYVGNAEGLRNPPYRVPGRRLVIRACIDCGRQFRADMEWKIRCLACWREARDRGQSRAAEIRALREQVELLRSELAQGNRSSASYRLDRQRVRQLLQLCHPDRHGGSPLSTEVSKWLNRLAQ